MNYNDIFARAIDRLHEEGRYRVFIDILRNKGSFPNARCFAGHNGPKPVTVWCSNDYLAMGQHPKVIALGEIGLDYYWMTADKETQARVFKRQMELAKELDLPFVVHTRDALEDTYALIKEVGVGPRGGIMHSFSGTLEEAQAFMDLGMHISFSGVVTFKKARELQEAAQALPLEKILVETDAPYLAPVPKRGRENRTGYTRYVVEMLAQLRNQSVEEVAKATYENARSLFRIDSEN